MITSTDGATPSGDNDDATTYTAVWDGDTSTFYDYSQSNNAWTHAKLSCISSIMKIKFFPRAGFGYRMENGKFKCLNVDQSAKSEISVDTVINDEWNVLNVYWTNCYYLKYESPDDGYGNAAEIKFEGVCAPASILIIFI